MAEKHPVDEFRRLLGEIHDLIQGSGELTYEQGVYMEHAFRCEADWINGWLSHEATVGVLKEHNERTEAELQMWRLKDEIEEHGWDPASELEQDDDG